jgi:predicted metal-dependent hydrolase
VELDGVDWQLLKEQKRWLLEQVGEYADGLINLLDYIQDAAEEQGQPVVWLTEEDDR